MRKNLKYTYVLILLVLLFTTITISAHSGKTDKYGGHYDFESGEYHYHHGYSAHTHYDIDGDGDIDCPKLYETEKNQNSVNDNTILIEDAKDIKPAKSNSNRSITNLISTSFCILVFYGICYWAVYCTFIMISKYILKRDFYININWIVLLIAALITFIYLYYKYIL